MDKVAESIKKFGWRQAVVVDSDGVIICGHTRWLAARKLALAKVPVHQADNLSPAEVKAYRLMDNRSHQETDWDFDLLGQEGVVNPEKKGTKAAAHYRFEIAPGGSACIRLRLTDQEPISGMLGKKFEAIFSERIAEADEAL